MPAAQFMAVFGPYAQRIDQVLDRFDPAVLDAAAGQVADDDDELPLRPEELHRDDRRQPRPGQTTGRVAVRRGRRLPPGRAAPA